MSSKSQNAIILIIPKMYPELSNNYYEQYTGEILIDTAHLKQKFIRSRQFAANNKLEVLRQCVIEPQESNPCFNYDVAKFIKYATKLKQKQGDISIICNCSGLLPSESKQFTIYYI